MYYSSCHHRSSGTSSSRRDGSSASHYGSSGSSHSRKSGASSRMTSSVASVSGDSNK